jgi:hypothetical protein
LFCVGGGRAPCTCTPACTCTCTRTGPRDQRARVALSLEHKPRTISTPVSSMHMHAHAKPPRACVRAHKCVRTGRSRCSTHLGGTSPPVHNTCMRGRMRRAAAISTLASLGYLTMPPAHTRVRAHAHPVCMRACARRAAPSARSCRSATSTPPPPWPRPPSGAAGGARCWTSAGRRSRPPSREPLSLSLPLSQPRTEWRLACAYHPLAPRGPLFRLLLGPKRQGLRVVVRQGLWPVAAR